MMRAVFATDFLVLSVLLLIYLLIALTGMLIESFRAFRLMSDEASKAHDLARNAIADREVWKARAECSGDRFWERNHRYHVDDDEDEDFLSEGE